MGPVFDLAISEFRPATSHFWVKKKNIFNFTAQDKKKLEQIKDDKSKNSVEKISLMIEYVMGKAKEAYIQKEKEIGMEAMRQVEKAIILQTAGFRRYKKK